MGASFTVKFGAIKKLAERFSGARMKSCVSEALRDKAVAALVGQAIADNFDKEGPGWAPLKAKTIRGSVSKKIRKQLSEMSDEELTKYEAKARHKESTEEPHRRILNRTGLLKKTATMPGFSGSSKGKKGLKSVSGSNIFKVEGTKLTWGTNLVYAGVHQKGSAKKKIPARPFLKLTPSWLEQIQAYVYKRALKYVKQAANPGGAV